MVVWAQLQRAYCFTCHHTLSTFFFIIISISFASQSFSCVCFSSPPFPFPLPLSCAPHPLCYPLSTPDLLVYSLTLLGSHTPLVDHHSSPLRLSSNYHHHHNYMYVYTQYPVVSLRPSVHLANRGLKKTTTATATEMPLNKRF